MRKTANNRTANLTGFNLKPLFIFLLLIFTLQLFTFNSYGQPSITWERLYTGPYDDDFAHGMCEATDGNLYIVGSASGFNYFLNLYLIKIDPLGNRLWSSAIGGANGWGIGFSVAPTLDGGCIATGDGAKFARFNSSGDTLWSRYINGPERRCFDIKRTNNNQFVACGRYQLDNGYLIKIDSNGNKIWDKVYTTPYQKRLYSIEEAYDGGYITVGRTQYFFGDIIKLFIVKTDTAGNTLWEKYLTMNNSDNNGISIIKFNNKYVITGARVITKLNIDGTRYDSLNIPNLDPSEQVINMKISNSSKYIYTSNYSAPPNIAVKLFITDSSGNFINSRTINLGEYQQMPGIHSYSNGDMIFSGLTYYPNTPKSNFYAIRTDSMFNFKPIGIIHNIENIPASFELYQNKPNPFNSQTTIIFNIIKDDSYKLEIYNLTGQKINALFNERKKRGIYEVKFDAGNLASGIYFYKLSNTQISLSKKFILLK